MTWMARYEPTLSEAPARTQSEHLHRKKKVDAAKVTRQIPEDLRLHLASHEQTLSTVFYFGSWGRNHPILEVDLDK